MNYKSKKYFLEIYGLLRIVLGVSQLAALFSGYFLLEWVMRYPAETNAYIVERDILLLTYFAVFLRGVFHTMTGIGLARLQLWGRAFLLAGWPLMLLVTFGLLTTSFHALREEGQVQNLLEMISWPKFIIYLFWAAFDEFFVGKMIQEVDQNPKALQEAGARMEYKNIFVFIVIAVFSISLVLFLGRSLKQGFYKGFYKTSTAKGEVKTSVTVLEQEMQLEPSIEEPKQIVPEERVPNQEVVIDAMFRKAKEDVAVPDPQKEAEGVKENVESAVSGEIESGLSYRAMVGYIGGFCIILALLFQVIEINKRQSAKDVPLFGALLLCLGFFLLLVYAMSFNLTPVLFMAIGGIILSGAIVLLKNKYE